MLLGENYLFVHVPKTAGQSIRAALRGTGKQYKNTHSKPDKTDVFTFGFVRNPWERMVSLYFWLTESIGPASLVTDGFKQSLLNDRLIIRGNKSSSDAMEWLHCCDYVGRFESLQKDFDYICSIIGVEKRLLIRINASRHNGYTEYFDDEMIEYVSRTHRKTIDTFGYKYG